MFNPEILAITAEQSFNLIQVKVVGLYDQNYKPFIDAANLMKADIKPTSKPCEHPDEQGVVLTDYVIFNPVVINLSIILTGGSDIASIYSNIKNAYKTQALFTLQTRTDIWSNQRFDSIPYTESSETGDSTILSVTMKEVQFFNVQFGSLPKHSTDQKTVPRGTINGQAVPAQKSESILASLADKF